VFVASGKISHKFCMVHEAHLQIITTNDMLLKCINPEFLYAEKTAFVSCCVSGIPKSEKYKALILK